MPAKHQVGSSVPENLSLFLDPAPKPEEVPRKMSKDSILSLYSTVTPHTNSMPPHGEFSHPWNLTTHWLLLGALQLVGLVLVLSDYVTLLQTKT